MTAGETPTRESVRGELVEPRISTVRVRSGTLRRAERDPAGLRSGRTDWSQSLPRAARTCILSALGALALTGCGNIEPWVKPYEREALADPIMSFDSNPVSTNYIHHVYEAREGARGALGGSGGGCGCL